MEKQSNLQTLKELVNNSVLERVKLCRYSVQAYNIVKGEEYAVIAAFAKQGGRYYFIDRKGRRFLASHYDRAEWLAGEVLEVLADDKAAVSETVDQLERAGSVLVCADFLALFFEECDRRNLTVKSTATGVDELERMLTRYDLVKQSDESNNDTQSDDSEDEQTAAEPSALAQKVAKVAEGVELLRERMQAAQDRDTAAGLERLNAAFAAIFRTLSDAVAAAQAETDRTRKADEVHQLREEIGTLFAEIAGMTERLQVLAQRLAELEAEQPDTATGNAATAGASSTAAEVAEESTTQGERFDRLDLLRNAAEDVERKTADNDHTGATLATLYALAACGVQVADLVPELRTIEANHHTRGYITPEEQQQRQAINDKARQRAAEVLTPEEWRTLYNTPHPKTSEAA